MGWIEGPVDERIRLMKKWETRRYTVEELAAEAGVTRQCLHKWIRRWRASGEAGMLEMSRAPLNPRRTDPLVIEQLLALKRSYMELGPSKLVTMMSDRDGTVPLSVTTAERILDSYGLVRKRRRRERVGPPNSAPRIGVLAPGHTLTADHKGYFRLRNGRNCYPLTLADPISRYLYALEAKPSTSFHDTWPVFERIFREYGVPDQILTDNGVPFCSARSLGGLTELSKRWLKLGIHVARIAPGRPQQNGTHERIHRTLDDKGLAVERTHRLQQSSYESFRYEYNWLRPHSSIGERPPAERLTAFRRSYPERLTDPTYPEHMLLRRINHVGEIKLGARRYFLSEVLAGELVGLDQADADRYEIYFGTCLLGSLDTRTAAVSKEPIDRE